MRLNQFLMLFLTDPGPWGTIAHDCLKDEYVAESCSDLRRRYQSDPALERAVITLAIAFTAYAVTVDPKTGLAMDLDALCQLPESPIPSFARKRRNPRKTVD